MLATSVSLDDKYTAEEGRVFMTGLQTLVRLPMTQMRRDRAAGLNTAAFISGYRGSPLGGYDQQLLKARTYLDAHDVTFQPGINEDLAATAVWGSQQVGLSREEWADNVQGAFRVPPERKAEVAGRRLILIDDVLTSGATVDTCARALLRAGAAHVDALVFARVVASARSPI